VTVAAAAKGEVSSQSETGSAPQEWAGQVFADKGTTYDQKMVTYVQKRATQGHREHRRRQQQTQQALLKAKEQELRCQRRHQRWARQASNQAWRDYCQVRKAQDRNWQILPRAEKQQKRAERREQNQERRERWAIRRAEVQARRQDDAAWHQARQAIRQEQAQLQQTPPPVSEWLSILAVLDNCTRVSPGLPIFAAGAHVTSETVVAGLEPLLPPELCYLISDNGTQFRAENFAALATRQSLVHVRIAPRRACTNGIAERFIQTLKKWLEEHAWHNAEELRKLLEEFLAFYNDRPHQGAALNGLSPNEYARRLAT
jgi:transposase InsO family protein